MKRLLSAILTIIFGGSALLQAQNPSEPADSLVRLMSAQSAEMVQDDGVNYRKVVGPASFLHNGTYLICDTAYWDVNSGIIKAYGNVKILQDETELTSERLDYYINDNLAQFRGILVQLQDKDRNTLRTKFLDYNTRDSVALFRNGASMRDKDGALIESVDGYYDSKTKVFDFKGDVNMYTDSVFIKTEHLTYKSNLNVADFESEVDIWRDANMLSANGGSYDRGAEIFHFFDNVHAMSPTQEGWADALNFHKTTSDLDLHGNVQVTDDEKKVTGMGEEIWYVDSLENIVMTGDATVIAELTDSSDRKEMIYLAADRISRSGVRVVDLSSGVKDAARKRVADMRTDPVEEYRRQAREKAEQELEAKKKEKAEAEGREYNPEVETGKDLKKDDKKDDKKAEKKDGKSKGKEEVKSTGEFADSTASVSFIEAVGKVRLFKSDIQARCDSLLYNDLDSLARLYLDPVIWNGGNRQYSADSLAIAVENSRMKKASLMSNAFIIVQEDSTSFDQIKGAEMVAYFDSTSALQRFDALGGASSMFYLKENDALATVNKVECKMLSAHFEKGEIQRIYYFEQPHNDAYPTVQLPREDKKMKGFKWDPDSQPKGMADITPYIPRFSERASYEQKPQAKFEQTEIYFPGYIKEVKDGIAARDSARKASREMRDSLELDTPFMEHPDSLAADSLKTEVKEVAKDSVKTETAPKDTVAKPAAKEDVKVEETVVLSHRDSIRNARAEAKKAKWEKLDERDAAKAKAKADKKQRKYRKEVRKKLVIRDKNAKKEQELLEKYIEKYRKKKERSDERIANKLKDQTHE